MKSETTASDLPLRLLASSRERIADRGVVASMSGGKDSTAMALHLIEQDIPFQAVFADTGWEHESMPEHLAVIERAIGRPIVRVGYPGGMEALCLKKGMFPSRMRRVCTQYLKVVPLNAYHESLDADVVSAVGIRAGESAARSCLTEWEHGDGMIAETWRPILRWTVADVIAIHQRHGVPPHPLYLRGMDRVGCWPCIFARKAEIRMIAEIDPGQIDRIEALERAVTDAAAARRIARGATLEGWDPPGLFQARIPTADGHYPGWPIRRVVEWARGNGQEALFGGWNSGCARWGMCEVSNG
jgi:3'-phosphoadenosine 5'-phosphosulfate sulfotransferase (PAPS reductase)/FAD synthetase